MLVTGNLKQNKTLIFVFLSYVQAYTIIPRKQMNYTLSLVKKSSQYSKERQVKTSKCGFESSCSRNKGFPGNSVVKNLTVMQEICSVPGTPGAPWRRIGNYTPIILAWKIPCGHEPGRLQSIKSYRVEHDWVTNTVIASQWRDYIQYLVFRRISRIAIYN